MSSCRSSSASAMKILEKRFSPTAPHQLPCQRSNWQQTRLPDARHQWQPWELRHLLRDLSACTTWWKSMRRRLRITLLLLKWTAASHSEMKSRPTLFLPCLSSQAPQWHPDSRLRTQRTNDHVPKCVQIKYFMEFKWNSSSDPWARGIHGKHYVLGRHPQPKHEPNRFKHLCSNIAQVTTGLKRRRVSVPSASLMLKVPSDCSEKASLAVCGLKLASGKPKDSNMQRSNGTHMSLSAVLGKATRSGNWLWGATGRALQINILSKDATSCCPMSPLSMDIKGPKCRLPTAATLTHIWDS